MNNNNMYNINNMNNIDNMNNIYNMNKLPEKSLENSSNIINGLYDGLTYYDLYGSSVFLVCFITFFVFLVCNYCSIMINVQVIKNDWLNQRCKTNIIPFAGLINKPDGVSIADYTRDNFTYCVQSIAEETSTLAVQPIESLTAGLTSVFGDIQNSINNIRKVSSTLRNNIGDIAVQIMSRLLNIVAPLQVTLFAFIDLMRKTVGILTTGLYTSLSSYYILQSLMGTMVESIIKMLIIFVGIITALWMAPFTWGAAATSSAIFLSIALPLALIIAMMSKVMHIQSSEIPKLKCFDNDVKFTMADGSFKTIECIQLGDVLDDNNIVTAKIKVSATNVKMYNLYNIIVSESHVVKFGDKWIKTCDHPESTLIHEYNKPYLYCLNTSKKRIIINDVIFTDWDEIYDDTLQTILSKHIKNNDLEIDLKIEKEENIHKYLDGGFSDLTMITMDKGLKLPINKIKVGDKLSNGDTVYGIVEIDASTIYKIYSYYLDNSVNICGGLNLSYSINEHINSTLNISSKCAISVRKATNESNTKSYLSKIYHLLTESGKFNIGNLEFNDYNYCIDSFLI